MRPITVIRAVQWAAIAVTIRSLGMPWGDEIDVGKGPPGQWERQVVGAALLLFVAALAMSLTARQTARPGRLALAVSAGASLGALALALSIRSTALDHEQAHLLLGGGWLWMAAGGCLSAGATVSALALLVRQPDGAKKAGPTSPKSSGATSKSSKSKKKKRR